MAISLRLDRKLNRHEAAKLSGISDPVITAIEEHTSMPRLTTLVELAKFYKVEITAFFKGFSLYEKQKEFPW